MLSPLVKWDDTTKRFTVGQEDTLIGKGNMWVVTKVCRVLFLQPTRIPYRSNGLRALGDTLAEGKASCSWAAGQGGRLLLSHGYPHGIQALAAASDHPLNRREAGKQTQIYTYRHAHGRVVWEAPQIEWEVATDTRTTQILTPRRQHRRYCPVLVLADSWSSWKSSSSSIFSSFTSLLLQWTEVSYQYPSTLDLNSITWSSPIQYRL